MLSFCSTFCHNYFQESNRTICDVDQVRIIWHFWHYRVVSLAGYSSSSSKRCQTMVWLRKVWLYSLFWPLSRTMLTIDKRVRDLYVRIHCPPTVWYNRKYQTSLTDTTCEMQILFDTFIKTKRNIHNNKLKVYFISNIYTQIFRFFKVTAPCLSYSLTILAVSFWHAKSRNRFQSILKAFPHIVSTCWLHFPASSI